MAKHRGEKKKKSGKKKDNFQDRLKKGLRFFSEEEHDKARIAFASALKSNPQNAALFHMLAESLLRSGDVEGGKVNYEEAFLHGADTWISCGLARLRQDAGDNDGAEAVLKESIEKHPKEPWGYLNLASFYRKLNQLEKALEILNKATDCAADLPVIWGLVQVLLEQEPTPEITGQFSKFLVMTPKDWLGYHLLSRCFIRQEQFEKAVETQDKAINLIKNEMSQKPKYLHPYYNKLISYIYLEKSMICFLMKNFQDGMVNSCLNVLRHNSKLFETMYFLGTGYLYQGLLDKGRGALIKYSIEVEELKDENLHYYAPLSLSSNLLIGQSYISQSSFSEAIAVYKNLIEDEPEVVEAYLNAGYSYFCLGDIEASKDMFAKLLQLKTDNLVALNNLGFLEMHQRNFQAAKDYFARAIEISPDYPLPYSNLGFILTVEGNYEEAIGILLKAIRASVPEEAALKVIYPSSKEENIKMGGAPIEENKTISSHIASLCNLGTCMARCKDYPGAHLCFDKLIEALPQTHFGYRGKAWTYFLQNDLKLSAQYMRKAFERNSENKVLQEEYDFIQSRAVKILETKKMASVLEGFFNAKEETSYSPDDTFRKSVEELDIAKLMPGEDGGLWDNLLIDKNHLLFLENNINKNFEEEIRELEMISSWQDLKFLSDEKDEEGDIDL